MNTIDSIDRRQEHEMYLEEHYPPFLPITPNTSEASFLKLPRMHDKRISTKSMMHEAIKSLSTDSRKGFSLAGIRKYILHNYLHSADEAKQRLPFVKKFLRTALERDDIISVKGVGLTGSFRVPPASPLHKNFKENSRKLQKKQTRNKKKSEKNPKALKRPVLKPLKVKIAPRRFSANM